MQHCKGCDAWKFLEIESLNKNVRPLHRKRQVFVCSVRAILPLNTSRLYGTMDGLTGQLLNGVEWQKSMVLSAKV
ncbi:hypothetical protein R3I94_019052 [Phoxinus phoxinus]